MNGIDLMHIAQCVQDAINHPIDKVTFIGYGVHKNLYTQTWMITFDLRIDLGDKEPIAQIQLNLSSELAEATETEILEAFIALGLEREIDKLRGAK